MFTPDLIQSYKEVVKILLDLTSSVPDPRCKRGIRHKIESIITITILALLCDQNDFTRISDWANSEYEILNQIMDLPHGIPSHDTFTRVIGEIPIQDIENLFMQWINICFPALSNHLSIDGKTVNSTLKVADCESVHKESNKNKVHVVSIFDSEKLQVVKQQIMGDKGGELLAALNMLGQMDIQDKIITGDAGFCNTEIATLITNKHGDFCLQVKDNQPTLKRNIIACFEQTPQDRIMTYVDDIGGHGRIEERIYKTINSTYSINLHDNWTRIRSIIQVQSYQRQKSTGKETRGVRYYVSSRFLSAMEASEIIRGHWRIESSLHAVLDGTFDEDECKSRQRKHAQNLAIFRHLVCGILRSHVDKKKRTVSMKRTHCRNDLGYRVDVLTQAFNEVLKETEKVLLAG